MKKWMVFVWSTLVCMAYSTQKKADYTPENQAIFDTYVQAMQGKEHLPLGDLLVETAKFFKDFYLRGMIVCLIFKHHKPVIFFSV